MRPVLLGMLLGVVIFLLGAFIYFGRGFAPVATTAAPMPFETTMARMALHARITKEAPAAAPFTANDTDLTEGAELYRESCAVCHGLSSQPETAIAKGMFPKPPQLFKGHGVTDDPAGETYWKVKNGIRLSGMPGFAQSMTDHQLWQVSLMLTQADKLPESARKLLAESAPMGQPAH